MNPEPKKTEFGDYTPEELCELYKSNPNLFEELADDAIRQACNGRTPQQTIKNRQLQWTMDAQLRKAKTPLGRLQAMEHIFYKQVFGQHGELARLTANCTELVGGVASAQLLPASKPALYLVKK